MVATGASHTIALKYDGTVWTWGNNTNGQLGNNSTENSSSPVQVKSADGNGYLTNIIEISAGSDHNMALSKDGTVFTWGSNAYGQLGNGSSVNSMLPVQVKSADGNSFLTDVVQISAGYVHSMALKKDGTVWTWGRNDGGQLGNNNTSNKSLPVQVKGGASGSEYLTDVVQVTAGNWHSMALKANGTVYAWGWGQYGQLGNGYTTNSDDTLTGFETIDDFTPNAPYKLFPQPYTSLLSVTARLVPNLFFSPRPVPPIASICTTSFRYPVSLVCAPFRTCTGAE